MAKAKHRYPYRVVDAKEVDLRYAATHQQARDYALGRGGNLWIQEDRNPPKSDEPDWQTLEYIPAGR